MESGSESEEQPIMPEEEHLNDYNGSSDDNYETSEDVESEEEREDVGRGRKKTSRAKNVAAKRSKTAQKGKKKSVEDSDMKRQSEVAMCPFGRNDNVWQDRCARPGVFPNGNPSNRKTHLQVLHPQAYEALRKGERLNPGTMVSPMNPIWAPHVLMQADVELQRKYYQPLSQLKLTPPQASLVKTWASMPAFSAPTHPAEKTFSLDIFRKLMLSSGFLEHSRLDRAKLAGSFYRSDYHRIPGRNFSPTTIKKEYHPVTLNGLNPMRKDYFIGLQKSAQMSHHLHQTLQIDPTLLTSPLPFRMARYHPYKL